MDDDVNPDAREDEELILNLDEEDNPDTSAAPPQGAKPPPVPGPSTPPPPQAGLEELNRQMLAERAERERVTEVARKIAEERDQAIAFAQEAERRGVSTYELYTENQIKGIQDRMVALSGQAEQAMQDGDFKRAQALNLEIGRLGGNLAVTERDYAVLVQQREQGEQQRRPAAPAPAQPAQPAQQPVPTDPFERALHGKSEATKSFLRKHPDLVRSDGTIKRSALDAHERAKDEGYAPDTPGYFEYIERSLMANTPQSGNSPPRGAPRTAAPVARDSGGSAIGGGGGGNGTFVMTPKMRRLAEEQGVEPREWARNYVRLLAEGRITPIT